MSAGVGDERAEQSSKERIGSSGEQRAAIARREVLKALGVTGGILAVHALMPREWSGPVVELTRLPAHAATSATCTNAVLTAARTTNGKVMLTWTGATGEVDIYRKGMGEPERKLVSILDAEINKYLDVTAEPNVAYEYTFQGMCSGRASVGVVP